MAKIKDVKSMDIKFNTEKEREEFVRWANDHTTSDNPEMVEIRKKMKRARVIKQGIRNNGRKQNKS